MIVVFSALLPGERLRWFHVAGALLGLAGTASSSTQGGGVAFEPAYALGYLAALGCALTWSAYSILSRRFRDVPTGVVAGFCLATVAPVGARASPLRGDGLAGRRRPMARGRSASG